MACNLGRFGVFTLICFLFMTSSVALVQSKERSGQENPSGDSLLPSLDQMVSSPFGLRNNQRKWQGTRLLRREHHGVDIKAPRGWPVISFRDGEVVQAGPSGGAGIVAKVRQSDSMTVVYAHLDKVLVSVGQKVARGQVLGEVGCTGRTTGSHLHLAMRNKDDILVDPLLYVKNANEIFNPRADQIPKIVAAEACGRIFMPRGRYGRPISVRQMRTLESFAPPPIPVWPGP